MKSRFGSPHSLKIAREQLSLSLDEVYELLNIKKQYLEILEDLGVEELENVISPVYARRCHHIYTKYLRTAVLNHLENSYLAIPIENKASKSRNPGPYSYWKLLVTTFISLMIAFCIKFS